MTNRQIDNRIKKLQGLEEQKKALEEQITALKEEIQEEMKDNELLETGNCIIHFTKVITERFDSKAFKQAYEDLFKIYAKKSESRRFSYSMK